MFEVTAIFSAVLMLATFTTGSLKLLETMGLEAESPIAVFQEMLPKIDTSDRQITSQPTSEPTDLTQN